MYTLSTKVLRSNMDKLLNLFPNIQSSIIFICYVIFCIGQGIFVTASRSTKGYEYNTVTVVFLTDATKLVLAYLCYIKDNSLVSLAWGIVRDLKILCLYLIPSFLYCIYNNLAFINLSHFDPTSYFVLLQLRVVITGIIFQLIFSKKLTKVQWFSLVLLTCGCMVQQIHWDQMKSYINGEKKQFKGSSFFSPYLVFIFIQTLCSCFAGVYNEHLLKDSGAKVNIFIQNIFMYIDSMFWNLLVLVYQGNLQSTFSTKSLDLILQPLVIIIILNNSVIGITTSLFLKSLNSILKTFASALELLITAVLSWIIFGIEIKFSTFIAIVIVSYSLYVYSQNPVNNKGKVISDVNKNKECELV